MPPVLDYRSERFVRKSELHVTIASARDQRAPAELRKAALDLVFRVAPSGIYRLVRQGARRSLIELVAVAGLEPYRARLGLPLPPAHITLFTEPGGGGIAIDSFDDLESLSVPAELGLEPGPWRLDGDGAILGM